MFVSSHLMSEMALTADHLIVVGKGRPLADAATADIIRRSAVNTVLVRTPQTDQLADVLAQVRATVHRDPADDALRVTGLDSATIGDLAVRHSITLHELTPQLASLEEAFMELTHDSVDFRAEEVQR